MNIKVADKHSVCLIGIFILGETLILAPFSGADSFNILALIIAVGVSAIFLWALSPLLAKVFVKKDADTVKCTALRALCYSVAIIFSLFVALKCFVSTVTLAGEVMLNNIPRIIIAIILSACVIASAYSPARAIYKTALITTVLIAVVIAVLFAVSLPHFEVRNIVPYKFRFSTTILTQAIDYFTRAFLPSVLSLIYISLTSDKLNGKTASEGVFLGGSLLVVCIAGAIMVFTAPTAAQMQFPYLSAVGVANVGELFTRADGFAYPVLIITSLIKIIVCLKVVTALVVALGFKYKKTLSVACGMLMVILAII